MSMSERGIPQRFLPGNATKFLHRRSMELLGLCLLTLAFSTLGLFLRLSLNFFLLISVDTILFLSSLVDAVD